MLIPIAAGNRPFSLNPTKSMTHKFSIAFFAIIITAAAAIPMTTPEKVPPLLFTPSSGPPRRRGGLQVMSEAMEGFVGLQTGMNVDQVSRLRVGQCIPVPEFGCCPLF